MDAAVVEFVRAAQDNDPIPVVLQRSTVSSLIGMLQFALRHPNFTNGDHHAATIARQFCEMMIEACSTGDHGEDYPLVRAMLKAGFDPAHDV